MSLAASPGKLKDASNHLKSIDTWTLLGVCGTHDPLTGIAVVQILRSLLNECVALNWTPGHSTRASHADLGVTRHSEAAGSYHQIVHHLFEVRSEHRSSFERRAAGI